MSSSSDKSANIDTPASSPPPANMDNEGLSKSMQEEEERMRAQREKNDAKRDAQLEKERQDDLKSGKEILDKKFQQLEFLMNKSKVSASWRMSSSERREYALQKYVFMC
jgi:ATP-dependent DNA helicase